MAIYDLSYIGTASNRVYFNDYTAVYETDGVIYRLQSRQPQKRNIRELDIPLPFEDGISDFRTLLGEVAYVIEGTMYPDGESSSNVGMAKLRKACSLELNQDDPLSDDGYVPYMWTEAAQNKVLFIKPLYIRIKEDTKKGLIQEFQIIAKIKDPTIYSETLNSASTGAADFTTASGTATFPFTFPIIFGASTTTITATATNGGDLPVYPASITVNGPVTNPKITNTTTSEYIQVNTTLATASNVLIITYDKDSVSVEKDGVSVIDNVTSGSTYFKLQPGGNALELNGSSTSNGAEAVMSYRSGWPLS